MRTFTFSDDKSYKFWNIELEGSQFTVTYGRIGTSGQTQVKEFANAAAAQKAYDKLILEKTGKGYIETTNAGGATAKAAATAAVQSKTGSVLEKALAEDPDDLATAQAYADELAERGDPRGEFIQAQLALEDPKRSPADRKKLEAREKELLKKHEKEWLGPLAELKDERQPPKVRFARGWLASVAFSSLTVSSARAVVNAPLARFLRELTIEDTGWEEPGEFEEGPDVPEDAEDGTWAFYPLLKAPFLGYLRKLSIGEDEMSTHVQGEQIANLIERMPAIEELTICAHRVDGGKLFRLKNLENLRSLSFNCAHSYPLENLAKNPSLGKLETLYLHPHAQEYDDEEDGENAYIKTNGLKALVGSKTLKSLKHVTLRLTKFGDKGIELIVKSGVLKQWKTLDLRLGSVTDAGADALAACPDLKKLDLLDLSQNALTPAGIKRLKSTGVTLKAEGQHSGEDEEYMYEGDIE